MKFSFTVWGARGSVPCPIETYMRYGGNTSCIEVEVGDETIVIDAGTGFRGLGQKLLKEGKNDKVTLLFSHTHWDHICGFPFFAPAFTDDFKMQVLCGQNVEGTRARIKDILAGQMNYAYFPIPLDNMRANIEYNDFDARSNFKIGDVDIKTAPLNHPNGANGFRIEYGGHSLCYISDTEHVEGQLDENILSLIEGSSCVIYDCTYTDQEYKQKRGWGHSTWQEGIKLSLEARAKMLLIFHHSPDRNDQELELLEAEARNVWSGALAAREGLHIDFTTEGT